MRVYIKPMTLYLSKINLQGGNKILTHTFNCYVLFGGISRLALDRKIVKPDRAGNQVRRLNAARRRATDCGRQAPRKRTRTIHHMASAY